MTLCDLLQFTETFHFQSETSTSDKLLLYMSTIALTLYVKQTLIFGAAIYYTFYEDFLITLINDIKTFHNYKDSANRSLGSTSFDQPVL